MLRSLSSYTPKKQNFSSGEFNFFILDKKLNQQKIQEQRQKQIQNQTLKLIQDIKPNEKLIKQCDRIMESYKNYYNTNRIFNIFEEQKSKTINAYIDIEKGQKNNQKNDQMQGKQPNKFRTRSTTKLINFSQKDNRKSFPQSTQNIMKPLRTNHYINKEGIINNIWLKKSFNLPLIKNQNLSRQTLSNFKITKNKKEQQIKLRLGKELNIHKSQKEKFQLKYKFRKNIWLIIEKLKKLKISFRQVIDMDIFSKEPYKFSKLIFQAVKQGQQPRLFRIIIQNRFALFSVDSTLKTPLSWACIRGFHKIAQLLLTMGSNPLQKDINEHRPIDFAIKYNHPLCVKIILLHSNQKNLNVDKKEMNKEIRKLFRVFQDSFKILVKLSQEKRVVYFQEQYKYDHYD